MATDTRAAIQEEPVHTIPPAPVLTPDHMIHHEDDIDIITDIDTDPYLPEEPDKYNDNESSCLGLHNLTRYSITYSKQVAVGW